MKFNFRRNLAILLSAALLVTCVPTGVYASIPEQAEAQVEREYIYEAATDMEDMTETDAIAKTEEAVTDIDEEETLTKAPESADPTPSEVSCLILEAEAEDGMGVTLTADEDAFGTCEGLELVAEVVGGDEAEEAGKEINKETGTENVARRVTYDIRVEKDGEEVQPHEGKKVKVEFHLPEVPSGADEVTVYHHDEEAGLEVIAAEDITGAMLTEIAGEGDGTQAAVEEPAAEGALTEEELEEYEDTELINDLTAGGETDSFSLYTVDFTYEDKKVSLSGDTARNPLADILGEVGITDPVTGVQVYQDDKFSDISGDGTVRRGDTILFRVYEEEGTWYVDAVNAFTSEHGIIVKTGNGDYRVKVTDAPVATSEYLTFTAQEAGSKLSFSWNAGTNVMYKASSDTVKYGTNNASTDWASYSKNTVITLTNSGDAVQFKGMNVITNNYNHFTMTTGKIAASGDVTSLTNGVGGDATLADSCYYGMFVGCRSLTAAPRLPSTDLAAKCYSYMFGNCSSLSAAPVLPATDLADFCYNFMFTGCTSLTAAPSLPATEMAANCYAYMFDGCKSITTAPALPSTDLADSCYRYMFTRCTSLTAAPSLPATTLAANCYQCMFIGCTSITTAPELPATVIAPNCYQSMFSRCTSLTTAPSLPATDLATNCYASMFISCTSITTAPKLPATALAERCYYSMFSNCDSLTTAPELPATDLAQYCYGYMFQGCKSLTVASELPATVLAPKCYEGMFCLCPSITTAPELPATDLADRCYAGMFANSTSLRIAPPSLPATVLSASCYLSMFEGCKSLVKPPVISATSMADSSCDSMFKGCTALKVKTTVAADTGEFFTCPAGMTSAQVKNMFANTGGEYTGAPTAGETYYYYPSVYTVTFDMMGHGNAIAAQEVEYGNCVTRPYPSPAETGFIFKGWFEEPDYKTAYDFSTPVTSEKTLYARWTEKAGAEEWTAEPTPYGSSNAPVNYGIWVCKDGSFTYEINGQPLRNAKVWIQYIASDKKQYTGCFCFDKGGRMLIGWQLIDCKWYYFEEKTGVTQGMMKSGWFTDPKDGRTYYLDPVTGAMQYSLES